jgi:hypothetical protein
MRERAGERVDASILDKIWQAYKIKIPGRDVLVNLWRNW